MYDHRRLPLALPVHQRLLLAGQHLHQGRRLPGPVHLQRHQGSVRARDALRERRRMHGPHSLLHHRRGDLRRVPRGHALSHRNSPLQHSGQVRGLHGGRSLRRGRSARTMPASWRTAASPTPTATRASTATSPITSATPASATPIAPTPMSACRTCTAARPATWTCTA